MRRVTQLLSYLPRLPPRVIPRSPQSWSRAPAVRTCGLSSLSSRAPCGVRRAYMRSRRTGRGRRHEPSREPAVTVQKPCPRCRTALIPLAARACAACLRVGVARRRVRASDLYGTARWRTFRALIRAERILCEACGAPPGQRAHHVEHIEPVTYDNRATWFDPNAVQLLCGACHSLKTARQVGWTGGRVGPSPAARGTNNVGRVRVNSPAIAENRR